jgi:hypothetical protein
MTDAELEQFEREADRGLYSNDQALQAKLALLEDAIVVYRERRVPNADVTDLMHFGFTSEEAESILNKYRYTHAIPKSFLVQTFMRKIQNEWMDRRRP